MDMWNGKSTPSVGRSSDCIRTSHGSTWTPAAVWPSHCLSMLCTCMCVCECVCVCTSIVAPAFAMMFSQILSVRTNKLYRCWTTFNCHCRPCQNPNQIVRTFFFALYNFLFPFMLLFSIEQVLRSTRGELATMIYALYTSLYHGAWMSSKLRLVCMLWKSLFRFVSPPSQFISSWFPLHSL
jgi:hypothetical protein